ncbi:MAG: hypothetical protein ABIH76_08010 [Candidatus Bathyarchaeota archaeon]
MTAQPPQIPKGVDLDFETIREDWNEYKLADGTTLKVKIVLTGVQRLEQQYTPTGDPVYVVASQNVVRAVNVPPELKRKSSKPPMGTTI